MPKNVNSYVGGYAQREKMILKKFEKYEYWKNKHLGFWSTFILTILMIIYQILIVKSTETITSIILVGLILAVVIYAFFVERFLPTQKYEKMPENQKAFYYLDHIINVIGSPVVNKLTIEKYTNIVVDSLNSCYSESDEEIIDPEKKLFIGDLGLLLSAIKEIDFSLEENRKDELISALKTINGDILTGSFQYKRLTDLDNWLSNAKKIDVEVEISEWNKLVQLAQYFQKSDFISSYIIPGIGDSFRKIVIPVLFIVVIVFILGRIKVGDKTALSEIIEFTKLLLSL